MVGNALAVQIDVLFFHLILVRIPFDIAHVWATIYPLVSRRSEGGISARAITIGPAIVSIFSVALFSYSKELFYVAVAYLAIFHISRQQYGWVMTCRRRAGEGGRRRALDAWMIWNSMVYPVLWWQSSHSPIAKNYSYYGSLHLNLPGNLLTAVFVAHWLMNLAYAGLYINDFVRSRAVNWAKLSVVASTWCWFYGALVIYQSHLVFFTILPLSHAAPYLMHSFRSSRRTMAINSFSRGQRFLSRPIGFLIFILTLAISQYQAFRQIGRSVPAPPTCSWLYCCRFYGTTTLMR